ncbi:MAG: efflux RND transporter periplasmic adaptor subunit [Luminiphilus sp.]
MSASIVAGLLFLWLGSGLWIDRTSGPAPVTVVESGPLQQPAIATLSKVRVQLTKAEPRHQRVVLRGRTEAKRVVDATAEISGQVVRRSVERGEQVSRGQLLCEIAIDDRAMAVEEARAALNKAEIEHEGSLKLAVQGLLSEVAIAASAARQEAAEVQLERQTLNLARTQITAPFDGVVEDLHLHEGDYAMPGDACATVIDLDPMLVTAQVTEEQVEQLRLGSTVQGSTRMGRSIEGELSFIGNQSDPVTRTYAVEITVDNQDYRLRSGLTVSLRVMLDEIQAHFITPSLLTLNEQGDMGVRVIDTSNRVVFSVIEIVEDGPDGMWVSGLPDSAALITVGQEYVTEGATVDPVYVDSAGDQVVTR